MEVHAHAGAGRAQDQYATLYCWRCDSPRRVILPWAPGRYVLRLWGASFAATVLFFPIIASDFCVMLPSMMAILVAAGPAYRLARERPICSHCSAQIR